MNQGRWGKWRCRLGRLELDADLEPHENHVRYNKGNVVKAKLL